MIAAEVRRLASECSLQELQTASAAFEADRTNTFFVGGKDDGEILSNYLAAIFVKEKMQEGKSLNEAIREYSQRVRSILS